MALSSTGEKKRIEGRDQVFTCCYFDSKYLQQNLVMHGEVVTYKWKKHII